VTDEYDIIDVQAEDSEDRPDPVARTLTILALILLIAVVSVGAGMVLYLRDGFNLPRSAAERDIAAYQAAVQENPDEQTNHIQLAYAYAQAGRAELAIESITYARQIGDNATVDLAEAEVFHLSGDNDGALVLYERAETNSAEEYARTEEEMRKKGIAFAIDKTVLIQATLGQAVVLWDLGETDDAIDAIRRALANAPRDASLQVLLGKYLFETGDLAGAEEAYLAALRFVPSYPPAVEGLRDIKEASGE